MDLLCFFCLVFAMHLLASVYIVNLRSKFVFMLGGIIPLIHYQEPVCISYQINLIL